jgi:hypothetical protein
MPAGRPPHAARIEVDAHPAGGIARGRRHAVEPRQGVLIHYHLLEIRVPNEQF